MAEPDVTLTDLGLALECGLFAWLLARGGLPGDPLRRWWLLFFGSVGVTSLAGGLVHGFFHDPASPQHAALWRLTLLAIGSAALAGWGIGGSDRRRQAAGADHPPAHRGLQGRGPV